MNPISAPRFNLDECQSDAERLFVEALHARAVAGDWFADSWRVRDERLTLSICLCDREQGNVCVLRTLRVDFDGVVVWLGPDETHQFATDLDPAQPGVVVLSGLSPFELANATANWLEHEIRRPIVRQEWNRLDRRGVAPRLWVLGDTGEAIMTRGQRTQDFGPPDRIVHVEQ